MSTKADFNAEEWETVVNGPPIAGLMVVMAESGGAIRESLQISKAYKEAAQAHMGPDLILELLSTPPEINPREFADKAELRTKGLEQLKEATSILEAKGTQDELDSYRGFVMGIAERVAHAHKSGSFLGFGGHEVSSNEQLALDEIRQTIGAHEVPEESDGE